MDTEKRREVYVRDTISKRDNQPAPRRAIKKRTRTLTIITPHVFVSVFFVRFRKGVDGIHDVECVYMF